MHRWPLLGSQDGRAVGTLLRSNTRCQPHPPALLQVTLLQWNASAPANSSLADVRPGMFVRVSDTQSCTTKNGAAAKCQLEFRSGDLNEAYVEGRPLYMGFYSTQVTQASGGVAQEASGF